MKPSYFSGRVHSVIFENPSKAFYILRLVLDSETLAENPEAMPTAGQVTIRGDVPGLKVGVGTWFGFEGVWDDHPQYGRQIRITRAPIIKSDWDADTCEKILTSHGVGPTVAASLKKHFGDDLAKALLDPEQIKQAPGLTKFTALHVHSRWQTARAHFMALDFLNDLGLPQGRIRQVWSHFGDKAQEVLSADPWSLVQIDGFTFRDADAVASRLRLDCTTDNPARLSGAVLYAARSGKGFGHLFATSGDLLGSVRVFDDFQDADIARAIKSAYDQGLLVLDRTTVPGMTAIYDPWSYKIESDSARALVDRTTNARLTADQESHYIAALSAGSPTPIDTLEGSVRYALGRLGAVGNLSLSPLQVQGVVHALTEPVSVISGLPGTGKTTSMRMAVLMLQEAGIPFLLLAPTGIAAKRIASVTGAPASTIHRAFKASGGSDSDRESTYAGVVGDAEGPSTSDGKGEDWGFGVDNPHPAQVVIVDESSMIDQHLLYRVLLCTRKDARLVFVGDAAQLPSVGPGNVLRDLIASGIFPTVALTEIFRQADTSPIIHAAHSVYRGEVPEAPVGSDFALLEVSDEDKVADLVCSIAAKLYDQRRNFQVLSPRHSGSVGVTMLNSRLRELLNPKQPTLREMKLGSDILREDDRIMVVKNDYKLGVFNGDVGKLVSIDRKNKEVEIKIHGPPVLHVKIPFAKVPTVLRLAYAVTVHKCQGLEYDCIVMPVVNSFAHQLQRNLFYTAITRARKKVVLVGTKSAVIRAVANERESSRNTMLSARLQGFVRESSVSEA
jgi:exodeoxyribonuclease V alpha subunit